MDAETTNQLAQGLKYIGVGLTSLGMLGAAIGVGKIFGSLLDGIARNPSAQKQMMGPAFIGAAFAEFMGLLAAVLAFMLLFG